MVNIARCTFSNCITTNPREPQDHRLKVVAADPLELRCRYCGRPQDMAELVDNLL
jgi:aspartate carbamoyltransferase regulatory subunit